MPTIKTPAGETLERLVRDYEFAHQVHSSIESGHSYARWHGKRGVLKADRERARDNFYLAAVNLASAVTEGVRG